MSLTATLAYMSIYWKHSDTCLSKLHLLWYFLQRILFKCGMIRTGENKWSHVNLQGLNIYFNMRTPEIGGFEEIFVDQVYEQEEEFIPKRGWTIFDIGANIGLYALRNAKRVEEGIIFSFEPNILVYNILEKNIASNNLKNIKAFPIAIGGFTGETNFLVSQYSTSNGSIMKWRFSSSTTNYNFDKYLVNIETLDNFISKHNIFGSIDLLKLDVEGAEYEALCGGEQFLNQTKRIVMEFHDLGLLEKIINKLHCMNFSLIRLLEKPNNIAYFMRQP